MTPRLRAAEKLEYVAKQLRAHEGGEAIANLRQTIAYVLSVAELLRAEEAAIELISNFSIDRQ
jgi:hypothetical protein